MSMASGQQQGQGGLGGALQGAQQGASQGGILSTVLGAVGGAMGNGQQQGGNAPAKTAPNVSAGDIDEKGNLNPARGMRGSAVPQAPTQQAPGKPAQPQSGGGGLLGKLIKGGAQMLMGGF